MSDFQDEFVVFKSAVVEEVLGSVAMGTDMVRNCQWRISGYEIDWKDNFRETHVPPKVQSDLMVNCNQMTVTQNSTGKMRFSPDELILIP